MVQARDNEGFITVIFPFGVSFLLLHWFKVLFILHKTKL